MSLLVPEVGSSFSESVEPFWPRLVTRLRVAVVAVKPLGSVEGSYWLAVSFSLCGIQPRSVPREEAVREEDRPNSSAPVTSTE